MSSQNIEQAKAILRDISTSRSVPRNIRRLAEEAIQMLENEEFTMDIRISNVISMLDGVTQDPNIALPTRVKIWQIITLLEEAQTLLTK